MWLRFIGEDGLMGLTHGVVYNCSIKSMGSYLWVTWKNKEINNPSCPYKTFAELLSDWEEVGDED